jgi:hypothetical protein
MSLQDLGSTSAASRRTNGGDGVTTPDGSAGPIEAEKSRG